MMERRLNRGIALLLTLCLMIPVAIALADDDAVQMKAYWKIVGNTDQNDPLTQAMNGAYKEISLEALKAVTADDLLAFSAANRLPVAKYSATSSSVSGQRSISICAALSGITKSAGPLEGTAYGAACLLVLPLAFMSMFRPAI